MTMHLKNYLTNKLVRSYNVPFIRHIKMDKNSTNYEKPILEELGDAKTILKDVFVSGTGDSFPGTNDALASS